MAYIGKFLDVIELADPGCKATKAITFKDLAEAATNEETDATAVSTTSK